MYLSAMAAGYLLQVPELQTELGVLLAIGVGHVRGRHVRAVNAFGIVKLRITPFMVTLATLVAGRGLGTAITESFGIEFPARSWSLRRLRRARPRRADARSSSSRSWSPSPTSC